MLKHRRYIEDMRREVTQLRDQAFTELDDHREAINADSIELSSHAQRLEAVEQRLEALAVRLDEIFHTSRVPVTAEPDRIDDLSLEQQQLFLILYASTSELSYYDLAHKAAVDAKQMDYYLAALEARSIPITYEYRNGVKTIRLDDSFKELQTKHNLVHIGRLAKHKTAMHTHVTLDRFGQ